MRKTKRAHAMKMRTLATYQRAQNEFGWAICYWKGHPKKLYVRRFVWGNILASAEARPDEEIRRAAVIITGKKSRKQKIFADGSYGEAVRIAEQASFHVKDPDLRAIARQTIINHKLGEPT